MQIYFIVVLLLSSGAVSDGLEKVLRLVEFITDIYQQFPYSCIFIINPEAKQQGKDKSCIILAIACVVVNRNVLRESWSAFIFKLYHHRFACKMCNERNSALKVTFLSFRIDWKCPRNSTFNKQILFIIILL
jgi:hypothetical protein